MSGRIQVNHEAVFSKTMALRNQLQARLAEMEAGYSHVQSSLHDVDSATNAAFMIEVERKKRKAYAASEVLDKLLRFIHGSAQQIQIEDNHMSRMFETIKPPKGGLR